MHFFKQLYEINDIHFISKQLQKIDKNYKLFFNPKNNLYEIHDTSKKDSFLISYKNYPDQKLLQKLFLTKQENMKNLFIEIEKHNELIRSKYEKTLYNDATDKLSSVINYSFSNPTKTITQKTIQKIINKGE